MDKREALNIASKYIALVNQKYHVERAILFGSFAKGTNHADSDIDIAIIFATVNDIIDTQIELMKMRRNEDLFIEPHPFSLRDFQSSNPVVAEIMKTGIEIINYAA